MLKKSFNENWSFSRGSGSSLEAITGGAAETVSVCLPHDASVTTTRNPMEPNGSGNGFFREENYVYTKNFSLDPADETKKIYLEFEGVYQNAFVYVNNSFAAMHPYGYGNFYVDITRYALFGEENTIKVIVKNGVPSGRWYTGGGIYRNVHIMTADRLHLIPDGIHLYTEDLEDGQAVICSASTVEYSGTGTRSVSLTVQLADREGRIVCQDVLPLTICEGEKGTYRQRFYLDQPELWDADHPYLYTYRAILRDGDTVLDEETGTFGVRKLQLDKKHGLRVNGKTVKLRGGCLHHDNGVIGTAEFPHAEEFRVRELKKAGFNAIRSSHYPMSRALLNACDQYGVYVMDEFADVWTSSKVPFDYGANMAVWWEYDLTNLINKDFNHPCVVLYSIGNEIPETGNRFDAQWGKKLADRIRELDPTRYVCNSMNLMLSVMDQLPKMMAAMSQGGDGGQTGEINSMMSDLGDAMAAISASEFVSKATEEAAAQVDILGLNYAATRYESDGTLYPNRILVGSETFPEDLDVNWELTEKLSYVIGDFDWTCWDYLGEAGIGKINYNQKPGMSFYASYPCKAAYCGDINLIGDRRPVSYWREIIWGLRDKPYIAVQPPMHFGEEKGKTKWSMTDSVRSWNWPGYEGKPAVIEVYTDADEAELFINGTSCGRQQTGTANAGQKGKKYIAYFEAPYAPGKIEAVVYKNGAETGRDEVLTASDDVHLSVHADASCIPADRSDICYVELALKDKDGILNPGIVREVSVQVDGAGTLMGYGSADPESEENYFDTTARTYEGRLRAAVRGNGTAGEIRVTFRADGCEDAIVTIQTK